jgi:anaerobic carbon-monoxide dehydrogenase iron sulfur subunit
MEEKANISRRDFLKNLAIGAGGLAFIGGFGVAFRHMGTDGRLVKGIIVDFTKCTGCRTCETVCSAFNHKVEVGGEILNGLGNPWLSNIKVHWFNPDVDVPMVCSLCDDAPCIYACPVPPDLFTGRKALYHDPETHSVRNDPERCIGCGQCAKTCSNMRTGVISQFPNGKPFGMCSLCDGDPQCVKNCAYDALSYVELNEETDFRKLPPETIARKLIWEFYEIEV